MASEKRIWGTLDAFVEGGAVLGRRVANSSFLRALLGADPYDGYHFFLRDEQEALAQRAWLAENFPALERRGAFFTADRAGLPERLARQKHHCFHLSDPVTHTAALTALRNSLAGNFFPVTSLTHSISYVRFMADFLKLLWPGVCGRDALICTSQSVALALARVFASLRRGYGLEESAFPGPEFALLPLGVDESALPGEDERPDRPGGRAARDLRERLDIGGRVMILSLARFSPASKMDCLPLLAALRRAGEAGSEAAPCVLVLAGWADEGDPLPEALRDYGRALGIETRLALRPSEAERRALYAAADIFVSPSDNIQESFGLTVAEAQASGLPVLASDFDGYRDIVVHGETGFLAPTLGFADTALSEARAAVWFDNQYLLGLAQQTAVSVPAMAGALALLCRDRQLRERMGRAARQRAGELFTWRAVMPRYCALWDELAARPLAQAQKARLRGLSHPQAMHFGEFFQGHFTAALDSCVLENLRLRRTALGEALYKGALPTPLYAGMERLLDEDLLRRALLAARKAAPAKDILLRLTEQAGEGLPPAMAREKAAFVLLWALKHDCLEEAGDR